MAHYQIFVSKSYNPVTTYNTDFAVGPSGFNRIDDVMLIQKMLRYLYIEQPSFLVGRAGAPVPEGLADQEVDGKWSDVLARSIVDFKVWGRKNRAMLFPDPIVLPCGPNAWAKSRVTGTMYTIGVLGNCCRYAENDPGGNPYVTDPPGWPYDEEIPKELRDALLTYREQAFGWNRNT